MKKNKGFTLLELLVVIAIIGILSTIVMVSLQGARDRAQDAALQSYVNQIRAQAQIYYMDNNGYADFFTNSDEASTLLAQINDVSDTVASEDSADGYCISAESVSDDNKFFCVDDAGTITDGTETCNATSLKCE